MKLKLYIHFESIATTNTGPKIHTFFLWIRCEPLFSLLSCSSSSTSVELMFLKTYLTSGYLKLYY